MVQHKQLDAKMTGFSKGLVKSFKGDFEAFKKWYDPKYKNMKAEDVWKLSASLQIEPGQQLQEQ